MSPESAAHCKHARTHRGACEKVRERQRQTAAAYSDRERNALPWASYKVQKQSRSSCVSSAFFPPVVSCATSLTRCVAAEGAGGRAQGGRTLPCSFLAPVLSSPSSPLCLARRLCFC